MVVGVFIVPMLAAVVGAAPVDVQGDTVCPRPGEVAAALDGLIGARPGDAPADIARLVLQETEVVVSLRLASSQELRSKRIAPELSCAERATAAAVIIAAWESRLEARPAGDLLVPAANHGRPPPSVVTAQSTRADGHAKLGLAAGALLSVNAAGFAGAALLEILRSRRPSAFGLSAGALFVDAHASDLGPGEASWRRFGVTSDVRRRISWSMPRFEASAGVVVSALRIAGRRYVPNQTSWSFDPGITAGVRVGLFERGPAPWLQIGGAFWPRSQFVHSTGTLEAKERLPRLEILAGLGASFGD
jgi:hypothetical protein